MSRKLFYILGILITIILGMLAYHHFCCKHAMSCTPANNTPVVTATETPAKAISTETRKFELSTPNFNYTCEDNFNFTENTFNHLTPISPLVDSGIVKLKAFMNASPNSRLKIMGYCTKAETNTSAYPNLGFARANDVKNYLVSQGINAKQFETEGQKADEWKTIGDTVKGPIAYQLEEAKPVESPINYNAQKDSLNMNPPTLYFGSMQSTVILTDKDRTQFQTITKYLDQVPHAQVTITGYSDSTGTQALNMQLSLKRAQFVKEYLVKNGIAANRITCIAKGSASPIADNTTEAGKSKNRRTVINLK